MGDITPVPGRLSYDSAMRLDDSTNQGCPFPDLLQRVLPLQLHVLAEPPAGAVVCGTLIEGPGDSLPDFPGALLLLIGVSDDGALVRQTVQEAAAKGYAGLVVRPRGHDMTRIVEIAKGVGLAVVAFGDEIGWRDLAALLDAALGSYVDASPLKTSTAGEELFTIADAIASTIGGSVAVEDLARRVLAYSSMPGQRIDEVRSHGILDRRVPQLPTDAEKYGAVLSTKGIVRFPADEVELARAAIAIRAGDLQLGTMWVIEGESGLSKDGEQALQEGARLAALHMLRARRATELDQQMRGDLLASLLDGTGEPSLAYQRLRIPNGVPRALLAFGQSSAATPPDLPVVAIAANEVARQVTTLRPDATVTTVGQAIYVLVVDANATVTAPRLARMILAALDKTVGQSMAAGIGIDETHDRPLTSVRAEADHVLSILGAPSAPRVATLRDVRVALMLKHVGAELARNRWLFDPALSESGSPRTRNTEIAATLMALFEALFDVRKAATALHIHPNTMRYRLSRIEELTGLDLSDADVCLSAWLQLRAMTEPANAAEN